MKTLIIYDEIGTIFYEASGSLDTLKEPEGIPHLLIEIPVRKKVVSVDISKDTHVPVFEDIPKSENQVLREDIDNLTLTLAAMITGEV